MMCVRVVSKGGGQQAQGTAAPVQGRYSTPDSWPWLERGARQVGQQASHVSDACLAKLNAVPLLGSPPQHINCVVAFGKL
jgi:hypothetical protein